MKDVCPGKTQSFSLTYTLLFDKVAGYIYLYCNFCSLFTRYERLPEVHMIQSSGSVGPGPHGAHT